MGFFCDLYDFKRIG